MDENSGAPPSEGRVVDNVRFYDEHAVRWAAKNAHLSLPGRSRFIELAHERNAHAVLDAGCGPGRDVIALLKEGFNAYGFDAAPGMVEEAHRRLREADLRALPQETTHGRVRAEERVTLGTFETVHYSAGYFDAVIGLASYLHVPRARMPQVLERAADWLKSGGLFGIVVKRGSGTIEKPYESRGERYTRTYELYAEGELEAVLEPRFAIIETRIARADRSSSDGLDWLIVFGEKRRT